MLDSDDEALSSESGYVTPPLSPSKTVSTEGWLSPRTPISPRKTRSCLFFRDIGPDAIFQIHPVSPTKLNPASHIGTLQVSSIPNSLPHLTLPSFHDESPTNVQSIPFDGSGSGSHSISLIHSDRDSSPATRPRASQGSELPSDNTLPAIPADYTSSLDLEGSGDHSLTPSSSAEGHLFPSSTSAMQDAVESDDDLLERLASTNISDPAFSPTKLSRLPLRHASSPLRSSQWVARGGLLSSTQHQSRTPDRFIPSRRPPNVTRESFELNKPAERVTAAEWSSHGGTPSVDPFRRRLRRSRRLNDELRGLRETHSILTGRANPNRRGPNSILRRGSYASGNRHVSAGAVWNVGGSSVFSDTVIGVSNGRGGMLGRGTNAPLYTSIFLSRADPEAELEAYEQRIALALDIDQTDRVLEHSTASNNLFTASSSSTPSPAGRTKHVWKDNAWTKVDGVARLFRLPRFFDTFVLTAIKSSVPETILFEKARADLTIQIVLDAPHLRDDYYCSLLAYSHTAQCLAVGLGNFVHLWSERKGVDTPDSLNSLSTTATTAVQHVTSLAFSSTQGGQAVLAVGRADGRIALWSPFDSEPRFDATQPKPISCVSFRPTTVKRPSLRDHAMTVPTEELLIRDEAGHIYFYSIEWPSETESALFGWNGAMTLLARMIIHSQQICGLSWSVDGELFASGGNDNACHLFETKKVLKGPNSGDEPSSTVDVRDGPEGERIYTLTPTLSTIQHVASTQAKHKWELNAAVKAIAFCPWQRGLLAIGGGSNDRCIHFYHTISGACLATIDCAAQVTSLVWSRTRREIAATFGFAQPEHPYRIAVFAWPSCEQVVAVPWFDENRALYAVPCPGGPDMGSAAGDIGGRSAGEDGVWWKRGAEEGCIVVAASDAAIRFHEIWTGGKKGLVSGTGLLGGSDILESLHGIAKEGEATIR